MPGNHSKLPVEAETVLKKVAKYFRARAAMYAALYAGEYDPERLPPIALEVESVLDKFREPIPQEHKIVI